MPPQRRRKGRGDSTDQSGAVTDSTMGPPTVPVRVRHTESELSSSDGEADGGKKFKPGTPLAARAKAAVGTDVASTSGACADVCEVAAADVTGSPRRKATKPKKKVVPVPTGLVAEVKAVTSSLLEVVMVDGVASGLAKKVIEHSGRYEAMLFTLMAENERLMGRLEVLEDGGITGAVRKAPVMAHSVVPGRVAVPQVAPVVVPVAAKKPVETWSVVVRGKPGATSEEVVSKVEKEVGPTLGVRVHALRPMRSGGAVIRTPSVAERERVVRNEKFKEVGLEVSVKDKLGPKVVVQGVHSEITPDEFMGELYSLNLKGRMTPEEFKRKVRLVSAPWKPTGSPVRVILEGDSAAMQLLLDIGRCYIKWFSFLVRSHDAVPSCYRCLGFDHMVRECRLKDNVCRICGQVGHVASRCVNEVNCRNCAFKGLPSGHLMMSAACPVYGTIVARANARH